jgi:hypothetical protein
MINGMKSLGIITLSSFGIFILLPNILYAQGFVPLSAIPGVTDTTNLGDYLNAAFQLGLVIATVLAVVMISLGGIEYMTTESITGKSGAKDRIENALIGLLLALLIWIILSTINPNLLKLDFTIKQHNFTSATPAQNLGDQGGTAEQRVADQIQRAAQEDTVNKQENAPLTERQLRAQNALQQLKEAQTIEVIPTNCTRYKNNPSYLTECIRNEQVETLRNQ